VHALSGPNGFMKFFCVFRTGLSAIPVQCSFAIAGFGFFLSPLFGLSQTMF
jgi:hypothetical protein